MNFEVHVDSDARVAVHGELDIATTPALTGAIDSLDNPDRSQVVLDLSGVTFIDSTAIAALCRAKDKLDARGAVLVLPPASSEVESMLWLVGLEWEFARKAVEP